MTANTMAQKVKRATVTVPADYADDFRAAIIGELATTIGYAQEERKQLEQRTYERDPLAAISTADLKSQMNLVARDARLLTMVGHEGVGDVEVDVDEDGTLAHVFETMARGVVGPRLSAALDVGPIEADVAAEIVALTERLAWAINRAAECHEHLAPGEG
jgi:hypothetical protein